MEELEPCNISSHISFDILPKPEPEPEIELCHQSLFSSSVYMKLLPSLLENGVLTSVKYFQHQLLTDVETIDIKSNNINIGFKKPMLT